MAGSDKGKRKPGKRKNRQREDRGEVFPFRMVPAVAVGEDISEFDAVFGYDAKGRAMRVLWQYLNKWDTNQLAVTAPLFGNLAPQGTRPERAARIEIDTGDEVRDGILTGIWSYLQQWTLAQLIPMIPVVVEYSLKEARGRAGVKPPAG